MLHNSCIFCQIITGLKSSHKIYEDDFVMAFLDIYPSKLGHVLLVPKFHALRFMEIPEASAARMAVVAQRILRAQQTANFGRGAKIKINDGPEGGQEVPHVHLHLVPQGGSLAKMDFESIQKKLVKALEELE